MKILPNKTVTPARNAVLTIFSAVPGRNTAEKELFPDSVLAAVGLHLLALPQRWSAARLNRMNQEIVDPCASRKMAADKPCIQDAKVSIRAATAGAKFGIPWDGLGEMAFTREHGYGIIFSDYPANSRI